MFLRLFCRKTDLKFSLFSEKIEKSKKSENRKSGYRKNRKTQNREIDSSKNRKYKNRVSKIKVFGFLNVYSW